MNPHSVDQPDGGAIAFEYAWHFVDELVRWGLVHAVICPGSRSTPLTMAFVRHPGIRVWRQVDERSGAFFALGAAKAVRQPAAVVCTSGTAAANFFPAVIESRYGAVPLVVLTADRPHTLRDVGALQSIDQVKLYGNNVKSFTDAAPPLSGTSAERYIRSVACSAFTSASSEPAGPAHVNFPFSEPLTPARALPAMVPAEPAAFVSTGRIPDPDVVDRLTSLVHSATRGLIVCGPQDEPGFTDAVTTLATSMEWPILAEPLSQLRTGCSRPTHLIDNYDLFLRSDATAKSLEPDLVLRFGMTPTSKVLLGFMGRQEDAVQISITSYPWGNDPSRVVRERIDSAGCRVIRSILKGLYTDSLKTDRDWLSEWIQVSAETREATREALEGSTRLSEPAVFDLLRHILPDDCLLFTGNSMPIRDLDGFFGSRTEPVRFLGNRGVNGIDGLVSSGLGAAGALGQRVFLVLGDLSLFHDSNGLLATRLQDIDATIIVLNNDGGGIFHFLPQSSDGANFETYFAVPTGIDFSSIVQGYGGHFVRVRTHEGLREAVSDGNERRGLTVIEVPTDRNDNVDDHRTIWESVTRALEAEAPSPL